MSDTRLGARVRVVIVVALAITQPVFAGAIGIAGSAFHYSNGNPTLYNGVSPTYALDTFDPQGSVSQILDSTGTVSATQLYDAYGTLLQRNSALFRQGISIGDFFRGKWDGTFIGLCEEGETD